MKSHALRLVILLGVASFMFFGYQCGSPEFTGAKVHIQQKNFPEAIRLLEIEVKKNPTNEEAWYLLGNLKADQGNLEGMNAAFNECLKISPKHAADIHSIRFGKWGQSLNAGVNLLEKATPDSVQYFILAIAALKKGIEAWPDTSLTYRYLAYVYNNKGDLDSALIWFKKAWAVGKDKESIKRAGRIYLAKGDDHKGKFETANAVKLKTLKNLEEVKKATAKDRVKDFIGLPDSTKKGPKNSNKEDWIYKAYMLTLSFDGDRVVDRKWGQPAFKLNIDSTESHLAMDQYEQAMETLKIARAADSTDNETLNALLKAYVESNRIEPAVREFEKAVKTDSSKTNHYILGVLYRTLGKFDDALKEFKEANRLDPNDCDVVFDIAATYYNWGVDMIKTAEEKSETNDAYKEKFRAALPYMEKVTECKKDNADVWETMGTIYARLGLQDKAMKAFDQADKIRKGVK
ncbi:MAG: tetratricopeptide repeat protein [Ignavibacteriales bacterium]|nr:tetratricopeptide repeat protein [Ignavibacteriales bacterium]